MNGALPWWVVPTVIFGLIAILGLLLAITTPPQGRRHTSDDPTPRKDNPPCPPA